MTEQEFLEIVSLHVETWYKPVFKGRLGDYYDKLGSWKKRAGKELNNVNLDDCILIKWCEGGVGGGSCWDDGKDNHYSVPGEVEPPFTELDIILEQVCPSITYLEYRKLLYAVRPELIEYDDFTQNEYYGNSTTYGYKKIVLRRLWERLSGLGLV